MKTKSQPRLLDPHQPDARRRAILLLLAIGLLSWPALLEAQNADEGGGAATDTEIAEEIANVADETPEEDAVAAEPPALTTPPKVEVDLFELLLKGGTPMIPICIMLIVVITFVIERVLGLRRVKVLPTELTAEFGRLTTAAGGFDPRKAYRACQKYPCAAASVIRAMLLKIGRPHSEVEHAVQEASEREAARLYANVRWLNLAAAVTPLMGLFGTVWGMINAFYALEKLEVGVSKIQVLSGGIVLALVTTLGGLFVAIPAAIAAHFFEGRIQTLFREIDELLFSLLPQLERYEGKLRVSRELFEGERAGDPVTAAVVDKSRPGGDDTANRTRTTRRSKEEQETEQPAEASN